MDLQWIKADFEAGPVPAGASRLMTVHPEPPRTILAHTCCQIRPDSPVIARLMYLARHLHC